MDKTSSKLVLQFMIPQYLRTMYLVPNTMLTLHWIVALVNIDQDKKG